MIESYSSPLGPHECSSNVCTKLYADSDRDDEVYERDGVEVDAPQSHQSHNIDERHQNGEGQDRGRAPRAEEQSGNQEDCHQGKGEHLACRGDNVGVLVEEDVKDRVREDFCSRSVV